MSIVVVNVLAVHRPLPFHIVSKSVFPHSISIYSSLVVPKTALRAVLGWGAAPEKHVPAVEHQVRVEEEGPPEEAARRPAARQHQALQPAPLGDK